MLMTLCESQSELIVGGCEESVLSGHRILSHGHRAYFTSPVYLYRLFTFICAM